MKKIVSLILLTLVCFSLASCQSKETNVNIDVSALTESLKTELEYTYKMEEVDKELALSMYSVDAADVAQVFMYSAGGVSAEEIAVFEATSAEAAERISQAAKLRIEVQIESFTDYVPAEVPKLNNAVIYTKGSYVIVSVSPDSAKASEIINGFFK